MPIRSVLVAGIDGADNQVVRFCTNHFLDVYHVPRKTTKPFPLRDATVIAASAVSHGIDREVKDLYKGRPIFYSNFGVSSFRADFEEAVYGKGVFDMLKTVSFRLKGYYLLARFLKPGDEISTATLKERMEYLFKPLKIDNAHHDFFLTAKGAGVVAPSEPRGNYVYLGITESIYEELNAAGLNLEEKPVLFKEGSDKKPFVVRKAYPSQFEPQPEMVFAEREEEEIPAVLRGPEPETHRKDEVAYLILEALDKWEKRIDAVEKRFDALEKKIDSQDNFIRTKITGIDERVTKDLEFFTKALKGSMLAIADQHVDQIKAMDAVLASVTTTVMALGDKVTTKIDEIASVKSNMEELESMLKDLDMDGRQAFVESSTRMYKAFNLGKPTVPNNVRHLS